MKIDNIFLLYKNSDKFFPTYEQAYFNSKKVGSDKKVYYVFTPTMQEFTRVSEIENCCRKYFNANFDCDYLDIIHNTSFKQLSIL